MASLRYFTGPMNCGKSTLALQIDFTETSAGRRGHRFTRQDRSGEARISSRLGMVEPAVEVDDAFDFFAFVTQDIMAGRRVDFLVCDEAQFYTPAQVDLLARVVDDLEVDVYCFGILTDFRTELFPGSRRLMELSDTIELLQARPRCWCGRVATHNARVVNGVMVTEGDQVAVGDIDGERPAEVRYEVLCRQHHRRRQTANVSGVALPGDPLPFGDAGDGPR
ncbi:thymidine kinase [Nigerium massiliense]|uniref:thymidine kinase n=1 Tax=Nigerium massiliense TaxID=1522317 RepID=UPI0005910073|nr:thymidine kinase [Nigerium massiliense]